jgi:hypothetical protein
MPWSSGGQTLSMILGYVVLVRKTADRELKLMMVRD